jgi:hypothetical protein
VIVIPITELNWPMAALLLSDTAGVTQAAARACHTGPSSLNGTISASCAISRETRRISDTRTSRMFSRCSYEMVLIGDRG